MLFINECQVWLLIITETEEQNRRGAGSYKASLCGGCSLITPWGGLGMRDNYPTSVSTPTNTVSGPCIAQHWSPLSLCSRLTAASIAKSITMKDIKNKIAEKN